MWGWSSEAASCDSRDEPLAEARVLGELRREHLERDLAAEARVVGR